jgi:hypothetical protein
MDLCSLTTESARAVTTSARASGARDLMYCFARSASSRVTTSARASGARDLLTGEQLDDNLRRE